MFAALKRPKHQERKGRRRLALWVEELESRTVPAVYSPAQIAHAYGFDKVSNTGTNQTIAIVDAYDNPNIEQSLATFNSQWQLPTSSFTKMTVPGQSTPVADSGWAIEIALDVEWAHAMAPGANIILVEAQDNSYASLLGAVNYAAGISGVSVVSMSWGSGEFFQETGSSYDGIFLNHPGVTFVASSGDSGAPPGWPAISPYVLSVGGTRLSLARNGGYGSEKGWSGSGGGISSVESKPAYQSLVTQSATKRTNPDVAYNADPSTGVYVYDLYNGGWYSVGGTSAGAPQWSALIARANAIRVANGLGTLDVTSTLAGIYNLPSSDFHDVTTGFNGYSAKTGYDLVTGRGTPKADLVIGDLAKVSSTGTLAQTGGSTGTPTTPPNGKAGHNLTFTPVSDPGTPPVNFAFVLSGIPTPQTPTVPPPVTGGFILAPRVDFIAASGSVGGQTFQAVPGPITMGVVAATPVQLIEMLDAEQIPAPTPAGNAAEESSSISPQTLPGATALAPAPTLGEALGRSETMDAQVTETAWAQATASGLTPTIGLLAAALFGAHWRNQPEENRRALLQKMRR